jgi:hypothetical protein
VDGRLPVPAPTERHFDERRQSLDAWTAARARADARQYAPTVRCDVEHPAVDERYRAAAESLWRRDRHDP